jgi:hypothetical protein
VAFLASGGAFPCVPHAASINSDASISGMLSRAARPPRRKRNPLMRLYFSSLLMMM